MAATGEKRAGRMTICIAAIAAMLVAAAPAEAAKLKTRTASTSAAGNGAIATATATCPAKTRAVGGGFLAGFPPFGPDGAIPAVYESVKAGQRGWRASAQVFELGGPIDSNTLTAYVYCREGAPKTKVAEASTVTPLADQAGPTVQAICPGGKAALAGGFATTPPAGAGGIRPVIVSSLRSGTSSWQVLPISGASNSGTVTSYAYCAKGKAPKAVATSGPAVGGIGTQNSALANCSGKRRPVHGGFSQAAPAPTNFDLMFESRRSGKGWQVSSLHTNFSAQTITSVAYCG